MEYLNDLDQSLPMFNLNIIIERSFSCFFGGRGERGAVIWNCRENWEVNWAILKNNSRKNNIYQQEKIVTNEKNVNKETISNSFLQVNFSKNGYILGGKNTKECADTRVRKLR